MNLLKNINLKKNLTKNKILVNILKKLIFVIIKEKIY